MRFVPRGNKLVVLLYVVFFTILLLPAVKGVGQYWDWTFPYYTDQIGNFFSRAAESWTRDSAGSPLGYSSDYFVRWFIALFSWMRPELLLLVVVLSLFVGGAYGVYLIVRHHTKAWLAFLLGLAAFVNPTIFYKFTAGHIDYFISYVLLIYMVYFLLYRFRADMRSAVVLSLMLALIGVQIQFLAIAAGLIVCFFVFRPDMWQWKFIVPLLALPLLINAVWLSNFVFGGADIARVSGEATKASFRATSNTDYINIFGFSFSRATLISRFYGLYELMLYGLIFVLMVVGLLKSKRKQAEDVWLLTFLLVLLFLATGLFQAINLGPLTTLYPMFREVGHFAPVIVLVLVILLGRLMPRGLLKGMIVLWLLVVLGVSFVRYQFNTQSISFAAARDKFAEFKAFDDQHPKPEGRVLAYPFFDQYAFTGFPIQFQENLPMRNSGHDSFAAYSSQDFLKNAIKPQDFKDSVQYTLLKTLDVDVLKPYNVRYIYDFSDIYESYYERYVPPSTYDGDVSWIKNNPYFLSNLLQANPGKLKRVSDHILEVTDYAPQITSPQKLYSVASTRDGEAARAFMRQILPDQSYDYIDRGASDAPARTGAVTPLLSTARPGLVDAADKALTQRVSLDPKVRTTLYTSSLPSTVAYQAQGGTVVFFTVGTGQLYANDKLIQDDKSQQPHIIRTIRMPADKQYYIGLGGTIMPLKRDGAAVIGRLNSGDMLELFAAASGNLVGNPSFEPGLWSSTVGDCNNYDKQPDINMSQATNASDGKKSLELQARRHDACTSTSFQLKGNSMYLLSYDYQSPNAKTSSFYLRFNNTDQGAIKRFQSITDDTWHTATYPIFTNEDTTAGQLFFHALGSGKEQATINRYDNVSFTELTKVGEFDLPPTELKYDVHSMQGEGATFRYVDETYSYANAVSNGSFEEGLWQDKVLDCNSYDKSPRISQKLTHTKTDGNQALELQVAHHAACTYTNVNIQPNTDYLLSFDYQADGEGQIGYYAEFDGLDTGSQDRITPQDKQWHTHATKIRTPSSATNLRLYLHAYESNGSANNIVRFDNVKLVAIPTLDQQFYVVSEPDKDLQRPAKIDFRTDSQTRRTITVTGANGPFALQMSETYHPAWRLELKDGNAESWHPGVSVRAIGSHFEASGYANGWYVDSAALCSGEPPGCRKNADGSYDIELVAEFVPQRWFAINRIISVSALVVASGYVVLTHRRARQLYDSEGIYRHPLVRHRKK